MILLYLIQRMKNYADRTLWAIGKQLADGIFRPDAFEKGFLTQIEELPHDVLFYMKGKIDRIDVCEDDEKFICQSRGLQDRTVRFLIF